MNNIHLTVCVVISNYSKLQNIEKSQDFIHCKMQGALNGKTIGGLHVVCVCVCVCHKMASLALRFYQMQFRTGLCPSPRWGRFIYDAPPHPL